MPVTGGRAAGRPGTAAAAGIGRCWTGGGLDGRGRNSGSGGRRRARPTTGVGVAVEGGGIERPPGRRPAADTASADRDGER